VGWSQVKNLIGAGAAEAFEKGGSFGARSIRKLKSETDLLSGNTLWCPSTFTGRRSA